MMNGLSLTVQHSGKLSQPGGHRSKPGLRINIIILIYTHRHRWVNTLTGHLAEQTFLKNLFTCLNGYVVCHVRCLNFQNGWLFRMVKILFPENFDWELMQCIFSVQSELSRFQIPFHFKKGVLVLCTTMYYSSFLNYLRGKTHSDVFLCISLFRKWCKCYHVIIIL